MAPDSSTMADLAPVRVWDPYVRAFHWLLVIGIVASWITGENEWYETHYQVGLGVGWLVLFRILWGFVGSRTARFTQFIKGPAAVLGYAKTLFARKPSHSFGHNAAGGLMVLVLLLAVGIQSFSGLFNTDDVLFDGPLYDNAPESVTDLAGFVHAWLFNILLALIALHVLVIALYLFWKRENLVRAMVTGRAFLPRPNGPKGNGEADFASPLRALIVAAIAAVPPIAVYVLN
ncbi:cytochrome b/b6 domain-containing protein [Dongia sedimenti]|uniref:Cytochrome b/b6 domain-containing protein n=1 Tax=Dongia sedimenti TaxID=3064282 RepID=A0ABU0YG80_9PROT|nr:cytochrome b/b6 domain-containing protein [Rhodospirillaceae bacterium R-7]